MREDFFDYYYYYLSGLGRVEHKSIHPEEKSIVDSAREGHEEKTSGENVKSSRPIFGSDLIKDGVRRTKLGTKLRRRKEGTTPVPATVGVASGCDDMRFPCFFHPPPRVT